jgi:hypothetical protein
MVSNFEVESVSSGFHTAWPVGSAAGHFQLAPKITEH